MTRFLIEVPHEAEKIACARSVRILLTTGSHFLTHADFGCLDGEHKAWIIVEGEQGGGPVHYPSQLPFSGQDREAKQVFAGRDQATPSSSQGLTHHSERLD